MKIHFYYAMLWSFLALGLLSSAYAGEPVISGIGVSATTSGATITWTTDEAASAQVDYGTSSTYKYQNGSTKVSGTGHKVVLQGLSSGTTYHFACKSIDAAGNVTLSSDSTFSTLTSTPSPSPSPSSSPKPSPSPSPSASPVSISSVSITNATTGALVQDITNGTQINLANLPSSYNIVITPSSSSVSKVAVTLSGVTTNLTASPYIICGTGIGYPCSLTAGESVSGSIQAFNKSGSGGPVDSFTFTVINVKASPSPSPSPSPKPSPSPSPSPSPKPSPSPTVSPSPSPFPLSSAQYDQIFATGSTAAHPRLLWTSNPSALKIFIILQESSTSPTTKIPSYYAQLKSYADGIVALPPIVDPRGPTASTYEDILWTARDAEERIAAMGTMYTLTGDTTYLNTGIANLNAILGFYNWNDDFPLDTSELTFAAAEGFDFFHDQLTSAQRANIVSVMISKGLSHFPTSFPSPMPSPSTTSQPWNLTAANTNMVNNGAALASILAIDGEIPNAQQASVNSVRNASLASLALGVTEYGSDGGFPEGVMYWGYANRYLAMLMNSFQGATGTDLGIGLLPGIKNTGYFPATLIQAPLGTAPGNCKSDANFGDAANMMGNQSGIFYYALRYQDPFLLKVAQDAVDQAPNGQGLMMGEECWAPHPPDFGVASFLYEAQAEQQGLNNLKVSQPSSLDKVFEGATGTAALHGSWTDLNAAWVGIRAGSIPLGHDKMDMGGFTYQYKGTIWVNEPPGENYNVPGNFGLGVGGARWGYYRNGTLGQSTMAFCLGSSCPNASTLDQGSTVDFCGATPCTNGGNSNEVVSDFSQNPGGSSVFTGLTSTYSSAVLALDLSNSNFGLSKWTRTFSLEPSADGTPRNALAISDDYAAAGNSCEFIWSIQTTANANLMNSGQSVLLSDWLGNSVMLNFVSQYPSATGSFGIQTVTLDAPQDSAGALLRITYTGDCSALPSGALHKLAIRIEPPSYATVAPLNSGMCLDVASQSTAPGALIVENACSSGSTQKFQFNEDRDGYYHIQTISNQCLEYGSGAGQSGAGIIQSTCTGADSQRWTKKVNSDGSYTFSAENGSGCLDVYQGSTASGTPIILNACNGTNESFTTTGLGD